MPRYMRQRGGDSNGNGLDVRTESDVSVLNSMIGGNNSTLILIYADWCGHCHRYLPTWDELEKTPGRKVNMAKVHYDMQEKIPALNNAKIEGYPSVVKVMQSGKLQEYTVKSGETTNALHNMRDMDAMRKELTNQSGGGEQKGGELASVFLAAIQAAGPTALLLLAHGALTEKQKGGFRSPKRQTRRGISRRRLRKTRRYH